jgi:hypothetical protein
METIANYVPRQSKQTVLFASGHVRIGRIWSATLRARSARNPIGATLGTERTSSERPSSRGLVDFRFSFRFCPYLAPSIPPRVRQQQTFKLATQDDPRVPITVLPALTASPLHFPLFNASCLAPPGNIQPTQATTTRRPYARSFTPFYFSLYVFPLSSFILHHRHLRGRRYYTNLRHN